METILHATSASANLFTPFVNGQSQNQQVSKTLAQGYYYLEVFTCNRGGAGFYKLMVDTPMIDSYAKETNPNPVWQVDEFKIAPETPVSEEIIYAAMDPSVYSHFRLSYFLYNSYYQTNYEIKSADIPIDATEGTIRGQFYTYLPYFS